MNGRAIALSSLGHLLIDFCQGAVPALLPFMVVERLLSHTPAAGPGGERGRNDRTAVGPSRRPPGTGSGARAAAGPFLGRTRRRVSSFTDPRRSARVKGLDDSGRASLPASQP
jgi:hypothetical protein